MADTPIHDLKDTWDDGGTTFRGIDLDVTDTGSASDSTAFRLRRNGSESFAVDKDGVLRLNGLWLRNSSGVVEISNDSGTSWRRLSDFATYAGAESGTAPKNLKLVFGALRNTAADGWYVIDGVTVPGTGHISSAIDSVAIAPNGIDLRLTFGGAAAGKVGTFIIVPDEDASRNGLMAGASLSTSFADVTFSGLLNAEINTSLLTTTASTAPVDAPAYLGDSVTARLNLDRISIEHNASSEYQKPVIQIESSGKADVSFRVVRGTSTTTIYPTKDYQARWSYDGATWNESYSNFLSGKMTASWSNQNLIINVGARPHTRPPMWVGVYPNLVLGSDTAPHNSNARCRFVDFDGNLMSQVSGLAADVLVKDVKAINGDELRADLGTITLNGVRTTLNAADVEGTSRNWWVLAILEES